MSARIVLVVSMLAGAFGCTTPFTTTGAGGGGATGTSSSSSTTSSSTGTSSSSSTSSSTTSSSGAPCSPACPTGQTCVAGACACSVAGESMCGGICFDPKVSVANCGKCGNHCETGEACVSGTCTCAGNLTCAGPPAVCTSKTGAGDPENCGACGTVCMDSQVCIDSACVCRPPLINCGGACVDITSDFQNCGGCGTTCLATEVCAPPMAGTGPSTCVLAAGCPANYTDCSGSCVLTSSMNGNPIHCGVCAGVCSPSEVCNTKGVCVPYFASPSCTPSDCASNSCSACGADHVCCLMDSQPLCVLGTVCGL